MKKQIVTSSLFVFFIVVFTLVSLVKSKSDFSEAENRALQLMPEVELDAILDGNFQSDYEDYLSDQFVGREFFVNLKTNMEIAFGKRDINGVYLGKDAYLIEKYQSSDFKEELVQDNVWYIADFLEILKDEWDVQNIHCLFVPSKGTVLEQKLPKYAEAYDSSFVIRDLQDTLEEDGYATDMVYDLSGELRKHGDEYIYYKTDHHWTTLGAYYAYCAYKNLCGEKYEAFEQFKPQEVAKNFYGSTYDKIQLKRSPDEITKIIPQTDKVSILFDDEEKWDTFYKEDALDIKDKYTYFMGGNFAKVQITSDNKNGKTLLLLKDSYSNCFVEYLAKDYENIYMIDLRYLDGGIYDVMEKIEEHTKITDVLVMYNTEKFMNDQKLSKLE